MPMHFYIRFEIWFDVQTNSDWRNIFRISDGSDCCDCGSRFPALFLVTGRNDFAILNAMCVHGNGNFNHYFFPK